MPGFGSMGLQEPFGAQMGVVQGTTTPTGDTLPFGVPGLVPTATGLGWLMMPGSGFVALGTLATGTTQLNCAVANYFTFTCYGGAMTLLPVNMLLGQTIVLWITGAGSAAITWPGTTSWVGVGSATDGVHVAPTVTSLTTVVALTCTAIGASPTYNGFYITG